jgi:hypothetical protein
MEEVRKENQRRWQILLEARERTERAARLAHLQILKHMEDARQGRREWPAASDQQEVNELFRVADLHRQRADDFVNMLLS